MTEAQIADILKRADDFEAMFQELFESGALELVFDPEHFISFVQAHAELCDSLEHYRKIKLEYYRQTLKPEYRRETPP